MSNNNLGAPETINAEIIKSITNAMRAGAYIETAVALVGISKSTFYNWCRRGNIEPSTIYGQLLHAVKKALAESEMRDLLNIDKCAMGQDAEYERYPDGDIDEDGKDIGGQIVFDGKGKPVLKKFPLAPDWSASAWRLERKFPNRWNKVEKVETSNQDDGLEGGQEEKDITLMSADELYAEYQNLLNEIPVIKK